MALKYGNLERVTKKLSGRLTVAQVDTLGITGVTNFEIGIDDVLIAGEDIELGFMDTYLALIYEMPLRLIAPETVNYLRFVAEDLICAEVIERYFPQQGDAVANNDAFAPTKKKRGLDMFQSLFSGLGIYVPGASESLQAIQNDENAVQLINKNIVLKDEVLKSYIGYDTDADGIADTDIFKKNPVRSDSFFVLSDLDDLVESDGEWIVDGVQTRATQAVPNRHIKTYETVSFW